MTQGLKRLADHLVDQLIEAGTWVTREEFEARQSCSAVALEDALADLVVDGKAEYRSNVGYRLAATPLCRRAARQLRRQGKRLVVLGQPEKEGYRVGVAEQRVDLGLVMYEMALPPLAPGEDPIERELQVLRRVTEFVDARGGSDGPGV